MFPSPSPAKAAIFTLLLSLTSANTTKQYENDKSCNKCNFHEDDEKCKVYGQLGDGNLIPWNKASQECLDSRNIRVRPSIDPNQLLSMFPNSDGSDGDVNAFISFLKMDSGDDGVVNGVRKRVNFESFFEDEEAIDGGVTLKKSILVDGVEHDCVESVNDCYDAIGAYFEKMPGSVDMQKVGKELWETHTTEKELEQSMLRVQLCEEQEEDMTLTSTKCHTLSTQIQDIRKSNPESSDCRAFGLGTAMITIPGCVPPQPVDRIDLLGKKDDKKKGPHHGPHHGPPGPDGGPGPRSGPAHHSNRGPHPPSSAYRMNAVFGLGVVVIVIVSLM